MKAHTVNHGDFSGPHWTPALIAELQANDRNFTVGSRIVSEEAGVRVWHISVPPGGRLPFHRHAQAYFWTVLGPGKSRSRYGSGVVTEFEYQAGDTRHFNSVGSESFIHDLENIGDTELVFVTVEHLR